MHIGIIGVDTFIETTIGKIVSGLIVAGVLALFGYIGNKNRKFYAKLDQSMKESAEVRQVLITPEPTELNQHPAPGVLDQVREMRMDVDALVRNEKRRDEFLDVLLRQVDATAQEVKKQSPNGENTNDAGDLIMRMARQQGVVLPDDNADQLDLQEH